MLRPSPTAPTISSGSTSPADTRGFPRFGTFRRGQLEFEGVSRTTMNGWADFPVIVCDVSFSGIALISSRASTPPTGAAPNGAWKNAAVLVRIPTLSSELVLPGALVWSRQESDASRAGAWIAGVRIALHETTSDTRRAFSEWILESAREFGVS